MLLNNWLIIISSKDFIFIHLIKFNTFLYAVSKIFDNSGILKYIYYYFTCLKSHTG
jgi:hypothetical protein